MHVLGLLCGDGRPTARAVRKSHASLRTMSSRRPLSASDSKPTPERLGLHGAHRVVGEGTAERSYNPRSPEQTLLHRVVVSSSRPSSPARDAETKPLLASPCRSSELSFAAASWPMASSASTATTAGTIASSPSRASDPHAQDRRPRGCGRPAPDARGDRRVRLDEPFPCHASRNEKRRSTGRHQPRSESTKRSTMAPPAQEPSGMSR